MRYFFQPDEDRFIYSLLEDDLTLIKYGPFCFGTGLTLEAYSGTGREESGNTFNVYGSHLNFRGTLGVDYRNLLITILADHSSFSNINSSDSGSLFLSGLKLGVENSINTRMEDHAVFLPAGYIPRFRISLAFYRPSGGSIQLDHILDWSVHGDINYPLLSSGSIVYGTIWSSDIYFHLNGEESSRHFGEVYASHHFSRFDLGLYLRHYLHDTQPIKPLHGKTCLGIEFVW